MCAAWGFPVNTVAMSTGYFHADPHPGNLLATQAGDLVYLDFGMMSEAPLSARFSPSLVLGCFFTFFFHFNRGYMLLCST
jgi:predicted unusual protein kinase regulating ubiquinone biosynthesis (AarF/ABC1/UbiB family)